MASASYAWLSVIVECGERVVKGREIVKCAWENAFGSLLLKFGDGMEAEKIREHFKVNENFFLFFFLFLPATRVPFQTSDVRETYHRFGMALWTCNNHEIQNSNPRDCISFKTILYVNILCVRN